MLSSEIILEFFVFFKTLFVGRKEAVPFLCNLF